MIDEVSIAPIAASGIGLCVLISLCIGCRRVLMRRRQEQANQMQQMPPVVQVVSEGEYIGGFTVDYPGYVQKPHVYPNQAMYTVPPTYVYGMQQNYYPQPSAPPGNHLATSVTV
jgi:hypothetical protein